MRRLVCLAVVGLGLLLSGSGCTSTTFSMAHQSTTTEHVLPANVNPGVLTIRNTNPPIPRFDDRFCAALQDSWKGGQSTKPAASLSADCMLTFTRNPNDLVYILTFIPSFATIYTFPWIMPSDWDYSAQVVLRDATGSVVGSSQSGVVQGRMKTIMTLLPTSWGLGALTGAETKKYGMVSFEQFDVAEPMADQVLRTVVGPLVRQAQAAKGGETSHAK